MPQFGRPEADTDNTGLWVDEAAAAVDIYTSINEVSADDNNYIQSPLAPSAAVYVTALSAVTDPASSSGHVMRTRYAKDSAGGSTINIVAQFRQGYVSEAAQGTLLVTRTFNDVGATFTTDEYSLSGAEADSITNYADLFFRYSATQA